MANRLLRYAATDNEAKKADVKAYQIGNEHNLSKRTNLYASYARLSNDKAANYTPCMVATRTRANTALKTTRTTTA